MRFFFFIIYKSHILQCRTCLEKAVDFQGHKCNETADFMTDKIYFNLHFKEVRYLNVTPMKRCKKKQLLGTNSTRKKVKTKIKVWSWNTLTGALEKVSLQIKACLQHSRDLYILSVIKSPLKLLD